MKKTAVLFMCVVLVLLCSCGSPAKKIVGSWTSNDSVLGVDIETTYTFNSDGTGSIETVLGLSQDITYEISDGKLNITTSMLGIKNTEVYTYTFEGDNLTLEGDNVTYQLTKSK